MPFAIHLYTLLNIRNATVCLLGAEAAKSLAQDIHEVLTELQVDVSYLLQTSTSGTILALAVQALTLANVMDCASLYRKRPAISNVIVSTVLAQDALVNPHAEFRNVTTLSIDLVVSMKHIYDLACDVEEGKVSKGPELEARGVSIFEAIMVSDKFCFFSKYTINLNPFPNVSSSCYRPAKPRFQRIGLIAIYEYEHLVCMKCGVKLS